MLSAHPQLSVFGARENHSPVNAPAAGSPEGSVGRLQIADDWDEVDDEECAALHREIAVLMAGRNARAPTLQLRKPLTEMGSRR